MKRIVIANLILLFLSSIVAAQNQNTVCHVYVVDVEQTKKAAAGLTGDAEKDAKALLAGQTIFPEFRPTIGEEDLTTKTYPFPGSSLIISASVFYTDESMASAAGSDSMQVGIVVSPRAEKDALSSENNAVSEVTLNNLDTVRAKKYVKVTGRLYLVGIECRNKASAKSR